MNILVAILLFIVVPVLWIIADFEEHYHISEAKWQSKMKKIMADEKVYTVKVRKVER
jgi:hypothetical protein